jgi:hypothetical protein
VKAAHYGLSLSSLGRGHAVTHLKQSSLPALRSLPAGLPRDRGVRAGRRALVLAGRPSVRPWLLLLLTEAAAATPKIIELTLKLLSSCQLRSILKDG